MFAKSVNNVMNDTDLGGNYDILNESISFENGLYNIKFSRKLNTTDIYDFQIPEVRTLF